MKKCLFLFSAIFILAFAAPASAASPFEGSWKVSKALGGVGGYATESLDEAKEAIGKVLSVKGNDVKLYNGMACRMVSAKSVKLDNTGFGTVGGDWGKFGIIPMKSNKNYYAVVEVTIKCPTASPSEEDTKRVIFANDGKLVLINFWETWATLTKTSK